MAKMAICKTCGKELAKSAKTCPHCGGKGPRHIPFWFKIFMAFAFIGTIWGAFSAMNEVSTDGSGSMTHQEAFLTLQSGNDISRLSPRGELAAMFNLMSDHTDVQRKETLKRIKGQMVQWRLPLWEIQQSDSKYVITIPSENDRVGCEVHIYPQNEQDKEYLLSIKTNDRISFRGFLSGSTNMARCLLVSPAILVR